MKKELYRLGAFVLAGVSTIWLAYGSQTAKVQAEGPNEPVFSKESGCYDKGFDLSITAPEGSTVYYTTDGSIPLAKEDAIANPTQTPVPTEKPADVPLNISTDNTEFVYNVDMEDTAEGTKLAFNWRYRSMCFIVPEEYQDWSKYAKVTIDYSVVGAHDGAKVGLQACPIYAGSPDSYGESGEYRIFEADAKSELGEEHVKWEINLSGKEGLDRGVGYFMLGATSLNSDHTEPFDTIVVHSITLSSDNFMGDPNPKQDTKTYSAPIPLVNRAGAKNVLAAPENIKLTYNTGLMQLYCPQDNEVAKATVIRALAVDKDGNRSPVVTKTYFVGNELNTTYKNASVISVVTDPDNLLDRDRGIYRVENYENKGKDWERPAFVEYFEEDGSVPFATNMGIRLHGGYSRHYGQKSFNLYFREELGGLKNLKNYQLIPGATNANNTKTDKYKSVMLRNGGNDTEFTKLADTWIQGLVADRRFTTQSTRPCVMFLNGEYWGLYNLTEKYSDNYLEEKFGVNKDNVIVIKDGELDEGQDEDINKYQELKALAELDMTDEANYLKFTDAVDIGSFVDYYALEIYIGNYDWPQKNYQLWRTRTPDGTKYGDGKWRFMIYDTEYSMEMYGRSTGTDPIKWALNGGESTSLFQAVYKNKSFRKEFSLAMCDIMNTNFETNHATAELEKKVSVYQPLMSEYFTRFGLDSAAFNENVSRMKRFVSNRRLPVLTALKTRMDAGSSTTLTVQSTAAKQMVVNTTNATLTNGSWSGTYFKKYPVTITAPDVKGYRFVKWSLQNATAADVTKQKVEITLSSKPVVTAVYESTEVVTQPEATKAPQSTMAPTSSPIPTASSVPTIVKPAKAKIASLKTKKRTLSLRIKKLKSAAGYQIFYSKYKNMKQAKKVSTTRTSLTLKKLISKKKYYIRVRAYQKDGTGKKVYGAYSTRKMIKIR